MQTSTPIQAHDPSDSPGKDPVRDLSNMQILVGVLGFTVVGVVVRLVFLRPPG